jgi:hypothetical protein
MTTVIHCKGNRTSHGNVVYIGRPSMWGNPFVIGRDGDRRAVIAKYENWLLGRLALPGKRPPSLAEIRRELQGKKLACWCAPESCHGDVLARLADESDEDGEHEPQPVDAGPSRSTGAAPTVDSLYDARTPPATCHLPAAAPALLIVASRDSTPAALDLARALVAEAGRRGWRVIVGDAYGVDAAVIDECDWQGVPVEVHGAYGRLRRRTIGGENVVHAGGYAARDREMVERCDYCVAVWNGESDETQETVEYARERGKRVKVYLVNGQVEILSQPKGA